MHWNHRLWKQTFNKDADCEETYYSIRETYYNEAGEICGCTEAVADMSAESVEELQEMLIRVQKVLDNPGEILDYDCFKFSSFGGNDNGNN